MTREATLPSKNAKNRRHRRNRETDATLVRRPANTAGAAVITRPRPAAVVSTVPPTSGSPMMSDGAIAGSITGQGCDPVRTFRRFVASSMPFIVRVSIMRDRTLEGE
jgi:hypothetical protein